MHEALSTRRGEGGWYLLSQSLDLCPQSWRGGGGGAGGGGGGRLFSSRYACLFFFLQSGQNQPLWNSWSWFSEELRVGAHPGQGKKISKWTQSLRKPDSSWVARGRNFTERIIEDLCFLVLCSNKTVMTPLRQICSFGWLLSTSHSC